MADISKGDWTKLTEQVSQLDKQVHSLAERAEEFKEFKTKMEPNMWFVTFAKTILIMFGVVVAGGIYYHAHRMGQLESDTKHNEATVVELKKAIDESRQEDIRLRELIYRQTSIRSTFHEGTVVRATDTELVIKTDPPDNEEKKFRLAPDAKVRVGGKSAKLSELKPGTKVYVEEGDPGFATSVSDSRPRNSPAPAQPPPGLNKP